MSRRIANLEASVLSLAVIVKKIAKWFNRKPKRNALSRALSVAEQEAFRRQMREHGMRGDASHDDRPKKARAR